MRKSISRILFCIPAALVALFSFCKFPYEPKPFVLPQLPYQFPDQGSIQSFLGTTNAKLVFTLTDNGLRSVYYVDLNDSAPAPRKLKLPPGKIGADSPLLSPDGNFVAYSLLQGNAIYGAYIQKLDTAAEPVLVDAQGTQPQWYKDASDSVFIIYATSSIGYQVSNLVANVGSTLKKQVSLSGTGSIIGSSIPMAPYPMIGGISSDGQYLCTGYDQAAFYNRQTSQLSLVNSGLQTCNPSIDPDPAHPNWMMFLNFAGVQNLNGLSAPAVQGNLGEHTVLFIVDPSNTMQYYIPISVMGSGYGVWQCPQWSNKPDFAVALAAQNEEETSWDLVILKNITTQDGVKPLKMTIGTGKMNSNSTPSLWIGG